MTQSSSLVLGIDPGSRITGFGFIRQTGNQLKHIDSGCIQLKADHLSEKLHLLQQQLAQLIQRHQPQCLALESIFYAKNVKSALTLAHARGVVLCTAAAYQLPTFEYSPLEVKRASVGYGRASKQQIHDMTCRLLNLSAEQIDTHDQTDALSVAICHLHSMPSYAIQQRMHRSTSTSKRTFR